MAEPLGQPLLELARGHPGGPERSQKHRAGARGAGPRVRDEVPLDGRAEPAVAREHHDGARPALQHEAGLPVLCRPRLGPLGQEREPLGPPRERAVEPAIALLERRQEALAQDEPGADRARDHAPHEVARAGAREHDREPIVGRQRPLERPLVVLDRDAARDGRARVGERLGDGGGFGVRLGPRRHPDRDDVDAGAHAHPNAWRASARTARA